MIYHTRVEYTNCIGGVMVSVFDSSVIDHGLQTSCIGGVMVSVFDSSVIDHGLQTNQRLKNWYWLLLYEERLVGSVCNP
jgi:hypothetical protein